MDLFITFLGAGLISIGVYDVFRTLFLPAGKGFISERIAHAVWRGCQRFVSRRTSRLRIAGPFAFLATAGIWTLLLVLGWAFIYWPWMPERFTYSPNLIPDNNAGFLDAVYLSMVTLATLGYGDITPDAKLKLARRGSHASQPDEVCFEAVRLQGAVDAFGQTLATRFLDMSPEPVEHVLTAYRRDHFHSE